MRRWGLVGMSALLVGLSGVAASCGGSDSSARALPPIITTTTSTTIITTTTEFIPTTYIIQSGDRLGNIAIQFGVSRIDLMAMNGLTDQNHIEIGQVLKIPPQTAPPGGTTTVFVMPTGPAPTAPTSSAPTTAGG